MNSTRVDSLAGKISPRSPRSPNYPQRALFTAAKSFRRDSRSPLNLNKTSLYEVPNLKKGREVEKIILTQGKMDLIKETLSVQQKAQSQFENRLKKNQMFFDYQVNPFSSDKVKKRQKASQHVQKQRSKLKQATNIIEVFKKKRIQERLINTFSRLEPNSTQALRLIRKSKERADHLKKAPKVKKAKKKVTNKQNIQNDDQSAIFDLERIAEFQEENFFAKKRNEEDFCLFEVIHNPGSIMFQSGTEQLENAHFCFLVSGKTSSQNIAQPISRQLSTYARTSCIKSNSKLIPNQFYLKITDLDIQLEKLSAIEMVLIANGQLNRPLAAQILNNIENGQVFQLKPNQEVQKNQEISFRQGQFNQESNIQDDHNKAEAGYWNNLELALQEKEQQALSTNYWKQMQALLKNQVQLLSKTIAGRSVHDKIEREKELLLCRQLQDDLEQIVHAKLSTQRRIRLQKNMKSKTESIKLSILRQTLKFKNSQEKHIKKKLREASRSHSNNKQP